MDDQNSNLHDFDETNEGDQQTSSKKSDEQIKYEYVFSTGIKNESSDKLIEKKRNTNKIIFAVVSIALCALVSFGAAFGGVLYANTLLGSIQNPAQQGETGNENESLHNENPGSVLDKSESDKSIYGSAGENILSVSQVANMVEDAIVVINATVATNGFFGNTTSESAGSGVIVSDSGYILTCNHVVDGAKSIKVILTSGESYDASLVGSDANSDLAVLKISPKESEKFHSVRQGCSADLVVGEYVVAIGNPLGTLSGSVTSGIISATERTIEMSDGSEMTLLQTDTAINSGNSGGGLFNLQGELIGIVNAKYASSGVEGLAFAIPIDSAYEVQEDLIQYGYVRGIMDTGLEVREITQSEINLYYMFYGINTPGVYVINSKYATELKNGDRIISVNGNKTETLSALNSELDRYKVGDTVTIVATRGDGEFTVNMTLQEYIPDRIKK